MVVECVTCKETSVYVGDNVVFHIVESVLE